MPPPNPGTAGGFCGHLFVKDNTLWTFGLYNDIENFQRTNYQLDMNGNLLNQADYDLPDLGFFFMQYSEAAQLMSDGSVLSAVGFEDVNNSTFAKVISYNQDWTENWAFEMHEFENIPNSTTSDYQCVIQLNDGAFIASGTLGFDTIPDQPGFTSGDFIITKFEQDGTVVWNKHYPFHTGDILAFAPFAVRTSDIFEMPNGDILVWGSWYHDWDPMVMRFDSEGNFISEMHWGDPQYNDWLPWPIQQTDSTFLFAYSNNSNFEWPDVDYLKPRLGKFNSNTMEVMWEIEYEYVHTFGVTTDFEQLDDNTFVMLGYGYPDPNTPARAFMLAADSFGNLLWLREYFPPISYQTPTAMDLEITSDGGLAFVGNFLLEDFSTQVTWIVKTDACGEEVFNGCPTTVAEFHLGSAETKFKITPNPASSVASIISDDEMQAIMLRDITGKIVYSTKLNNHVLQTQVDVSVLAKGLYLVEVDFGEGRVGAQKLVVE
jgi:hypothetical protein